MSSFRTSCFSRTLLLVRTCGPQADSKTGSNRLMLATSMAPSARSRPPPRASREPAALHGPVPRRSFTMATNASAHRQLGGNGYDCLHQVGCMGPDVDPLTTASGAVRRTAATERWSNQWMTVPIASAGGCTSDMLGLLPAPRRLGSTLHPSDTLVEEEAPSVGTRRVDGRSLPALARSPRSRCRDALSRAGAHAVCSPGVLAGWRPGLPSGDPYTMRGSSW